MNTKPFHAALTISVCLLTTALFSGCGGLDLPADGGPDVTTTTTVTTTAITTTTTTTAATTVAAAPTAHKTPPLLRI